MTRKELEQAARDMGATGPDHGINWTWMNDFPTEEAANQWHKMLTDEGYETRGVYPPQRNDSGESWGWSIRYR